MIKTETIQMKTVDEEYEMMDNWNDNDLGKSIVFLRLQKNLKWNSTELTVWYIQMDPLGSQQGNVEISLIKGSTNTGLDKCWWLSIDLLFIYLSCSFRLNPRV